MLEIRILAHVVERADLDLLRPFIEIVALSKLLERQSEGAAYDPGDCAVSQPDLLNVVSNRRRKVRVEPSGIGGGGLRLRAHLLIVASCNGPVALAGAAHCLQGADGW